MSQVTCHMSHVTCHMSPVTCQKNIFLHFLQFFYLKKVGKIGEASRWRVCYQRGLPRLVSHIIHDIFESFPDLLKLKDIAPFIMMRH